jgi:hypothetical protein
MAKRTFRPARPLLRIAQTLEGAKAAPYPGFIPFYNPSLKAKVPIGAGWLYEIKFDGYRCGIMAQTPQESESPGARPFEVCSKLLNPKPPIQP